MSVGKCGFQLSMILDDAYAPRGARAYSRGPKNWSENISLLAAISLNEDVSLLMVEGVQIKL